MLMTIQIVFFLVRFVQNPGNIGSLSLKVSDTLRAEGYQFSKNDYSLFFKKMGGSVVFLAVYVDDILLTGNCATEMQHIKQVLD